VEEGGAAGWSEASREWMQVRRRGRARDGVGGRLRNEWIRINVENKWVR